MNAPAGEAALLAIADSLGIKFHAGLSLAPVLRDSDLLLRHILALSERIRRHRHNKSLTATHINEALASMDQEELLGYLSGTVVEYVPIGNGEILAPTDRQLSTRELAASGLVEYPCDTNYTIHWLAIDGVQPLVRENVSASSQITVTPEELHWPPDDGVKVPPGRRSEADLPCEELRQLMFSYISSLQTGEGFADVVENLRTNGSLQVLVPYFGKYFSTAMAANATNPRAMLRILEGANALFRNDSVDLGTNFTVFLSLAMTPMLSESLLRSECDLQYSVRDEAAAFMGLIVAKSGMKFPRLLGIVADKLAHVVCDESKPMCALYGAVAGVRALGCEMVKSVVIPRIEAMMERVCACEKSQDVALKMEALHLRAILMNVTKICLETSPDDEIQRIMSVFFERKSFCVDDVCNE